MLGAGVAARLAERRGGAAVEPHARGAGQVGGGVAGALDVVGRHHEDAGAAVVGQRGGHDEHVGRLAADDGVGHAVERPRAVGHGGAYAVRARGPATAGGGVGRGQHDLAGAQPAQQVGLLLRRAERRRPARRRARRSRGRARARARGPAPGTRCRSRRDRRRRRRRSSLNGQAEDAHLGQPAPQGAVEARLVGHRAAPRLVVGVRRREQAADGLAQRLLLVVVGEVHASASQSPRIVRLMIWRWISLDPP